MNTRTVDSLTRFSAAAFSRRASLLRLSGVPLAAIAAVAHPSASGAKKKRHKRKKKCKPRCTDCPPPPEPACADACESECSYCFNRPDGATLCGAGYSTPGCNPCSSDNDCVATTDTPYCTTHGTERATGERFRWDGCPPYSVGICTRVLICLPG